MPDVQVVLLPYEELYPQTTDDFKRHDCVVLQPRPSSASLLQSLRKADAPTAQERLIRMEASDFEFQATSGIWVRFPFVARGERASLLALARSNGFVSRLQLAIQCACDEWSVKTFIMRLRKKYSRVQSRLGVWTAGSSSSLDEARDITARPA